MKEKSWLWILGLAAIFLYTFNLGALPLRDWDEGIVATVAREIYRADFRDFAWLFPLNLDGTPYWNKPPLVHDLIALSYGIFGVSEWSIRLVPSLLGACTVPLVYLIGKEIFSQQRPAILSALVYLTLIPVVRHQRLAMLDGAITTEFCFAVWCWLLLQKNKHCRLLSLSLGLGFSLLSLTKGLAIALLLYGILGLITITELVATTNKKTRKLSIIFFLVGLIPGFAWYGLQYLHYGQDFLSYNLGTQTFNRVVSAVENNSQPVWYYLLELLKYSLPWLIFLPGGISFAWKNRYTIWVKLSLIWFGAYLGAISLMTTKLPWYIMPLYPVMALLVGAELDRVLRLRARSKYWMGLLFLAVVFTLGAGYLALFDPLQDKGLIVIALIFSLTFILATLLIRKNLPYFVFALVAGLSAALLMFLTTPHAIWELAEAYPVKPVAKLVKTNTPENTKVYTNYPFFRPSLDFYSDRLIIPLQPQQLAETLTQQNQIYLLQTENYPQIATGKTIEKVANWQLLLVGN